MVSASTHRGLGITAGLEAGLARDLAARCEQFGYHSLWSNGEPAARGLDTLAKFAAVTAKVQLGVGVLPLHRYQPAQIAADVDRLGIDPARLWLGIGSWALPRQIDALQRAVAGGHRHQERAAEEAEKPPSAAPGSFERAAHL